MGVWADTLSKSRPHPLTPMRTPSLVRTTISIGMYSAARIVACNRTYEENFKPVKLEWTLSLVLSGLLLQKTFVVLKATTQLFAPYLLKALAEKWKQKKKSSRLLEDESEKRIEKDDPFLECCVFVVVCTASDAFVEQHSSCHRRCSVAAKLYQPNTRRLPVRTLFFFSLFHLQISFFFLLDLSATLYIHRPPLSVT